MEAGMSRITKLIMAVINITMVIYMFQMMQSVLGQVSETIGGGDGGGAPPPEEGYLLYDDFNDNSIDSSKWDGVTKTGDYTADSGVYEQNQQLEVKSGMSGTTQTRVWIASQDRFSFASGKLQIEVDLTVPSSDDQGSCVLLSNTGQNSFDDSIYIYIRNGSSSPLTQISKKVGGSQQNLYEQSAFHGNGTYKIVIDSTNISLYYEGTLINTVAHGLSWTDGYLYLMATGKDTSTLTHVFDNLRVKKV